MVILKIKIPNSKKLRKESLTSSNINKLNIHENKTCEREV
jgi:hypothetical protein